MNQKADIIICGAGIAGIAAAYTLAVKHSLKKILLVDERPPMTLTSSASTECYRNWWPGPGNAMVGLMNRSIDLLEEMADASENSFQLNRRGYLYLTADPNRAAELELEARQIEGLGAGQLRVYKNDANDLTYQTASLIDYRDQPAGADLLLGTEQVLQYFPYLNRNVKAALHVRRAGWFSGQQLGMYMLEQARQVGVKFIQAKMSSILVKNNYAVGIKLDTGEIVDTGCLILANGPFIAEAGRMLGIELPVFCERHLKIAFRDPFQVVPRDAPLLIWTDPQELAWTTEEKTQLIEDPELAWLTKTMPPGVHTRPEGGQDSQNLLMLWDYQDQKSEPIFPLPLDPDYPEIVLRGMTAMIPGLERYIGKSPRPVVDGGYYTKTIENRPLIGKLPIQGTFMIGALSGYGMMAAASAAEILAAQIMGSRLPDYAADFSLDRYDRPGYLNQFSHGAITGQL